jgi:hypothetical protein
MNCKHIKPDGSQCKAHPMTGADYCFIHNPEAEDQRAVAIKKGALSPKPRKDAELLAVIPIKNIDGVLALIEDTINRIRTEPMTHQKANCIGYLANIALKAFEVGEVDEKMDLVNSVILERRTKIRK